MNRTFSVATSCGEARVHGFRAAGAGPLLVLGHGAGGGPDAADLLMARDAALSLGWAVLRVEQPWRVAGRRVAAPARQLDHVWTEVVNSLRADGGPELLVVGGRSTGARVACRTAQAVGAAAVLALAFPLVPPGRTVSRADELAAPVVPRLVVQGGRDAFGMPAATPGVLVAEIAGADHGFRVRRRDGRSQDEVLTQVRTVVRDWLVGLGR